ncbi:leucyl aminopeptidase [Hyphomicrobium denitrificans 1NES1]|uniref:Probable cytosol aminopeptidase n=1 Tax=Hyphomicrobium denitrificans 1NES1 TaxID=670307 RepID=N0BC92_9HYPH|nr:leucyl aminopeptidase [Hyphomicrobium denitrificans]AGK57750.1 leucyl aminopeptidase [Hyphomicrobium denitrificans 1NES1]
MSERFEITFASLSADPEAVTVILAGEGLELGSKARELETKSASSISKAAAAADYKGKYKATIEILAPAKLGIDRLIVAGLGKEGALNAQQYVDLGGAILGAIQTRKASAASLIVDVDGSNDLSAEQVAALIAQGALLRHYTFKKYLTKKPNDDTADKDGLKKLIVHVAHPDKAKAAFHPLKAVANGVNFARDLVNEPANILGPVELAEKTKTLEKFGVSVDILDVKDMEKLGMGSLLCVGQGSARPSRLAVMVWNGAKGSKKQKPVCFVGKGVVFDTGGISIKPAAGMEDMKGDMGGAAAVIGTMYALAERKANVNAVGLVGCVENMPSGAATRPGDIVTSMSGQTIEVINTDAEGRLVLADVLWYAQEKFKPKLVIDLATLTGAIMIALGKEYAGMFVNDDKLADELLSASRTTGEKLWRMPLDKAFDKMMDSKNADMKNAGGRWGGSASAAAFLQRFVQKDTPWCHLDIAGTAMDGSRNDINQSWGAGWGIRLLDRFVAEHHEKSEK